MWTSKWTGFYTAMKSALLLNASTEEETQENMNIYRRDSIEYLHEMCYYGEVEKLRSIMKDNGGKVMLLAVAGYSFVDAVHAAAAGNQFKMVSFLVDEYNADIVPIHMDRRVRCAAPFDCTLTMLMHLFDCVRSQEEAVVIMTYKTNPNDDNLMEYWRKQDGQLFVKFLWEVEDALRKDRFLSRKMFEDERRMLAEQDAQFLKL
jgi:hypothetical protein